MASMPSRLRIYNLIDGKPIELAASQDFSVISARTGNFLYNGQTADAHTATRAVESTVSEFSTFKKTLAWERHRMLLHAAELIEKKGDEIMRSQILETSCDEGWASFNVRQGASIIRTTAATMMEALTGDVPPSFFGHTTLVFKEPVGPVLVIPPWNGAVALCCRVISAPLAAGCTIVMKASELCPATHQLLVHIFHEAGFSPSSVNMVMADRSRAAEITEVLISHPGLRKIEFIGSMEVGKLIATTAAKYLKPIILELGDQSPAIILDDADLPRAAKLCAKGSMLYHGQICFSTERIIVQRGVKEEFEKLLVQAVQNIHLESSGVTYTHVERAKAAIDAAIEEGAKFLCGDSEVSGLNTLTPSILTNVGRDSAIFSTEAFAPTAFITVVDTEEEAIEEANSRQGGLSAAVFSRDYQRSIRVARELNFGGVQINNMTVFAEPAGPVTSTRGSGYGESNGKYGVGQFLISKAVCLVE